MKIKFKVTGDIAKSFKKIFVEHNRTARKLLPRLITDSISKGISPVEGHDRFSKYSNSYLNAINKGRYALFGKKPRPVNLNLTGRMLSTIRTKSLGRGSPNFYVEFRDNKAVYHNEQGAGKSKTIRRMLPLQGETFNRDINFRLEKNLVKLVKKSFK